MKLTADQTITQRCTVLEEALFKVLDRDEFMSTSFGDEGRSFVELKDPFAYHDDPRLALYPIEEIARELEVLLS
ncbi:hypothetical protein [Epibacterium ulvae]|uniref:hypothetical protein n=1 Tax=Epibacterium ulvae TaxID=1156985 RepID=UPI002491E482|nr:hypothetical protein [Epibacterium ulvae]